MNSSKGGKQIRIGLFPEEFADQLDGARIDDCSFTSSNNGVSRLSVDDSSALSLISVAQNGSNEEIIEALQRRFPKRKSPSAFKVQSTTLHCIYDRSLRADTGQEPTRKNRTNLNGSPISADINVTLSISAVNKIATNVVESQLCSVGSAFEVVQPTTEAHTYKSLTSSKRSYTEIVAQSQDIMQSGAKRFKLNANVYRAVPLTLNEIEKMDATTSKDSDWSRISSPQKSPDSNLSFRTRLPIFRKFKSKHVEDEMLVDIEVCDVTKEVEKMKTFRQNCLNRWMKVPSTPAPTVPSILRSRTLTLSSKVTSAPALSSLASSSTLILQSTSSSTQPFTVAAPVSTLAFPIFGSSTSSSLLPTSTVVDQSSSNDIYVSTSAALSTAKVVATTTPTVPTFSLITTTQSATPAITSFITTTDSVVAPLTTAENSASTNVFNLVKTSSAPSLNLGVSFTGAPAIPSTFQFGSTSNLTNTFLSTANMFSVNSGTTASKTALSARRRKR